MMHEAAHSPTFSSYVPPLFKMALTWLAALAVAGGHHAFNASLNGKSPADGAHRVLVAQSQVGASFIGTTFAFLASSFLGISGGIAFIQSAWRVVQRRSFTLAGLDALWSSTNNPFAFISIDFWKSAREVVLIAGLSWSFSVVTFAPGTLSVQPDIKPTSAPCLVPTFDFGSSALLYDQLTSASKPYFQPSTLANRVVGATLRGGQPFAPTSPCTGNCSYLTTVNAPAFNCTSGFPNASDLTWAPGSGNDPPPWVGGTFNAAPPLYAPYSPAEAAAGGGYWDFAAHYADARNFHPTSAGTNFSCVSYNATYHLNYTFLGAVSSISIERVSLVQAASQIMLGNNSQRASSIDDPDFVNNSMLEPHSAWFNTTTNYYALLSSLYSSLGGNITMFESGDSENYVFSPTTLAVTQSHLATSAENGNITWADVAAGMESLLANITLSMLTIDPSQRALTTCVHSNSLPYFSYNKRRLWLVYGVALGIALVCDVIGIIALVCNRFGATADFTDFLAAARNPELNDVDLSPRNAWIRLRYGMLGDGSGRHAFVICERQQDGNTLRLRTSNLSGVSRKEGDNHEMAPLTLE
ncbi:hypothetical protein B0H11DRAFT_2268633 [Mycena galericulata]|nr:hypothetical protein B0H11DRAFT_2268633 [Mycena galericulata]